MKKFTYIFILYSISFVLSIKGQDPMFSQFYANPMYLSPSLAGATRQGSRVALNYRDQWPNIPHTYTTYSMSFDHYLPQIRSGIGLFVINDRQGSVNLRMTHVGFLYSFDFQVDREWHVRPGINFQYFQSGIDYHKYKFYSQLVNENVISDIIEPIDVIRDIDLTASVLTYNENYWFGLTLGHMLKPEIFFYNYNLYKDKNFSGLFYIMKYSFYGGTKIKLRGNLLKYYKESLTLAYLYEQQEKYKQLSLGAYYHKNPLVFGVWYRGIPLVKGNPGHDAIVFLLGYMINDFISLGYSFDLTVSGLKPNSGGAHELSLTWDFLIKKRSKKPTALPCPHI